MRLLALLIMLAGSQACLAQDFLKALSAYNAGDYAGAMSEWRPLAEDGAAGAQYMIGNLYVNGLGVKQDFVEGARWYRRAAEHGSPDAMIALAHLHIKGLGVTEDPAEAARWFRYAAMQGRALAQVALAHLHIEGLGVAQDLAEAARWYSSAAAQGNADAQYALGLLYLNGAGVLRDEGQAARLLGSAADQGHAGAQYNLGVLYASGRGVAKDNAVAVHWYNRAAAQGHADAQNNLGTSYATGQGTDTSAALAVYWYALAAQQGQDLAADNIEITLPNLAAVVTTSRSTNLRAAPSTDSEVVDSLEQGRTLYKLAGEANGWYEVYSKNGHRIGYVSASLVAPKQSAATRAASTNDKFPPAPAPRQGYETCSTRCINADCYRTYSDGRQVRFQAKQVWDAISNSFAFDSGGC